jgi:hypothetical protein
VLTLDPVHGWRRWRERRISLDLILLRHLWFIVRLRVSNLGNRLVQMHPIVQLLYPIPFINLIGMTLMARIPGLPQIRCGG